MTTFRHELTEPDFADPIDWVYEVRRRVSERYGHDIDRYMNALRTKQREDEAKGIHVNYVRLPIARREREIWYNSVVFFGRGCTA